mgnify:CR=1 FL=1
MKKNFLGLLPSVVTLTLSLIGCTAYRSKPGTKKDICGTYQLEKIEKKDDSGEKYDYKSQINAEAYFSIDEEGYGYYAYKDKDTELKVSQVFSTFVEDDDNSKLYKAIDMTDGYTNVMLWEKKVGCLDEPTMGFNAKNKTLSYTILRSELTIYKPAKIVEYQDISYKKISDKVGLDVINEKTNQNTKFDRPFEMSRMDGFFVANFSTSTEVPNEDYGKYEYMIADMDSYNNGSLDVYYSLAEHPGKTKTTATIQLTKSDQLFKSVEMTILGKTYTATGYNKTLPNTFVRDVITEPDQNGNVSFLYSDSFSRAITTATTVDDLILEILADK